MHSAHPDRGGDGEAFIQLFAAYHQILDELDRRADPIAEPTPVPPPPTGSGPRRSIRAPRERPTSPGSGRFRRHRARKRHPGGGRHPRIARAILLVLILLSGALIVIVTWIFGPEVSPLTGLPVRR